MKFKSGNTPLIKNKGLCNTFGIDELYVKDESRNPFGTWKDRRSEVIVKRALALGYDKVSLITSGNAGYSLARFARESGLRTACIFDGKISDRIGGKLGDVCDCVVRKDLSGIVLSESEIISLSRENDEEKILEATTGFHDSYKRIIDEIKDIKPDYIVCPLGSGEAFVGLYFGLRENNLKTILVGVRSKSRTGSFADKLYGEYTPYEAEVNKILGEGNLMIELSEEEIRESYAEFKKYFDCEPSSAVVFRALRRLNPEKDKRIVLVNSGKGI